MSGEVVDTMDFETDENREWLEAELAQDDLDERAMRAAELATEAVRQEDGDALQGIAMCLLAFKRREVDP